MTFVRMAGCSVGCDRCDTDYRVHRRVGVDDLVREVCGLTAIDGWVWLTGGEPTDHDLGPLAAKLRSAGLEVALATSGHREVRVEVDWLSVSPHDPGKWVQRTGDELKVVPRLNGEHLIRDFACIANEFDHRFVLPCDGRPETVRECVDWVEAHPDWRMTVQAHKHWSLS